LKKAFKISPYVEFLPAFFSFPVELENGVEDVWVFFIGGIEGCSHGGKCISWGGKLGNGGWCVVDDVGMDDGECTLVNDVGVGDVSYLVPCSIIHNRQWISI
jgi:hypothetical protein